MRRAGRWDKPCHNPQRAGPDPREDPEGSTTEVWILCRELCTGGQDTAVVCESWGVRTCWAPMWYGGEWERGRPGLLREEKCKESSLKIVYLYSFSGRRKEKKTNVLMTSFSKIESAAHWVWQPGGCAEIWERQCWGQMAAEQGCKPHLPDQGVP